MIKSHTCGFVGKSICRWNDQITHVVLWIGPFVGGMIKSHACGITDISIKWTYPQYHVCVILSLHLQMDLSTFVWFISPTNGHIHNTTCVWFYHSTYKWTYPQYHVFEFIIPPTNGHIHNTTCVWFYHPFVGGMIKSHTCGIVDMSICRWNEAHKCGCWHRLNCYINMTSVA
jgi:hypothetical protein